MADSLGQHLLFDLYGCLEKAISSPAVIQDSVAGAIDAAQQQVDEISCQVLDDEIILTAIAPHFHIIVHVYPDFGYVAADVYSFALSLQSTVIMKELRSAFGADRVRATSVHRGDFGTERDMKPRRKTTLTALGRVTRTRTRLKNTGTKIRTTGVKVIKGIIQKNRNSSVSDVSTDTEDTAQDKS